MTAGVAAPRLKGVPQDPRPTGSKVHRNSVYVGSMERRWWRPFDRQDVGRYLTAAERWDRAHKAKGRRNGPLGHVALEVLRELMRQMTFKTGACEPSIGRLMERLKRSKDAVVRALARLKLHGFLDWLRRVEPTGEQGIRGPQVQQATNAYRLSLPKAARALLGWRADPPPLPEDEEDLRAARRNQSNEHRAEERGLLGVLDRYGEARAKRESARRDDSRPRSDLKGA